MTYKPTDTFFGALNIQGRVIHALLMREILTRYGRHNIGFMWLFVEPMIFTLGIATLWTFSGLHVLSNIPIVAFAVTGYSSVLLWRNMLSRSMGALQINSALLYHRNVTALDVWLSRSVLEAIGSTASFAVLSLLFWYVGSMPGPEDVVKVVVGWLLLAWFGVALSMTVGAASEFSPLVEKIWHPITYLMFPLSGAVFMVEWLPRKVQDFVLMMPMVHGVEILREGFFGSRVKAHYDLTYMFICCLCLTFIGLVAIQAMQRKVTPE